MKNVRLEEIEQQVVVEGLDEVWGWDKGIVDCNV